MRSLLWGAALVGLLAAPVTAAPRTTPSDNTLDHRIEHRIKADRTLKKYDIDVSVKDHVATLTGKVATDAQRTRAGRMANIAGVARVDNKLEVNGSAAQGT